MNSVIRKILNRFIRIIEKAYIDEYKHVLEEVKGLILTLYADLGEKPLLSKLYRYNKYYNLIRDIQEKLTDLGVKEEQIFTQKMVELNEQLDKQLSKDLNVPFEYVDKKLREEVEKTIISDKLWSESIWRDKAQLLNKVKHEIIMHVTTGKSIDEMAKALEPETLTHNFYNAKRLVRTEVAKYTVNKTVEKYKQAGITQVRIKCLNDSRTCKQCSRNNNKLVDIDKVSSMIPAHPNCRCYFIGG